MFSIIEEKILNFYLLLIKCKEALLASDYQIGQHRFMYLFVGWLVF